MRRATVLIAGGGVAALETVLALRALAGWRISITLLAPEAELLYRPVTVAEPFGRGEARSFAIDELLGEHDVDRVRDALREVRPEDHRVVTAAGDQITYDMLVVATGARAVNPLPGALAFGGRDAVPAMGELLAELDSGAARSVAFALCGPQAWSLPLYELALLTAAHLRERGRTTRVILVTPEEMPLALFGRDAARVVEPLLLQAGIVLHCRAMPSTVRPRELWLVGGGALAAERVVTLPELVGPALAGLPADHAGFIRVDAHGRARDVPDVYAAGDVTAFPLKQGGLAAQQADAVAEHIAQQLGVAVTPRPFIPILRGLLITSGAPVYMRCEPWRLDHPASPAIFDRRLRPASDEADASRASDQALWWPPAKVAGRYLAPYLATARPSALAAEPMLDRRPVPGPPVDEREFQDAVELALLLADGDARWGDYRSALAALDSAEALQGTLPHEYQIKRRLWSRELRDPC